MNDDSSYMLCSCSDRTLKLYFFDFISLEFQSQSYKNQKAAAGKKPTEHHDNKQRIIYLKNEMRDVVNGRKW